MKLDITKIKINKIAHLSTDSIRFYAKLIIFIQFILYPIAFNLLMPSGMFFSPDSVAYLSNSNIVPPFFSLFSRFLLDLDVSIGHTQAFILRYIAIIIYSFGGWLIARSMLISGKVIVGILVIPVIWSVSSLTMWFNYYLTDGISTAFIVACIGAYANLHVSIQNDFIENNSHRSLESKLWLYLFIIFGMMGYLLRPAFAFIAPTLIFLIFNKTIFSWNRLVIVSAGVIFFVVTNYAFTKYWHGEVKTKIGQVLTALVFDFPLPNQCSSIDSTNLCNIEKTINPFIQESLQSAPQQRFIYKALNNGNVTQAALSAIQDNDNSNQVLKDIAILKIKSNLLHYFSTVLQNSFYSLKTWGDWYRHDNLGHVALQGIEITANNAEAVQKIVGGNFNPFIKDLPDRPYKDAVFQTSRLILSGHFVADNTLIICLIALIFSIFPLIISGSVYTTVLFACCVFSIFGIIFQNALFPVIPRLLAPFQPLGFIGTFIFTSIIISFIKSQISNFKIQ